ncbi:MAG: VOC family protein [Ectothiorhodospiraceae bacterium]|nr:VOC family protein [Ectothiorhodospiraceae bacterium]
MSESVRPVPEGFHTLTPYLTVRDAPGAMAFYCRAFGAEELVRIPGPDGRLLHACLRIGDSMLMLTEEFPEFGGKSPQALGGTPLTVHIYVDDVDSAWSRAVNAGCQVVMPLADAFWGDRFGCLIDPFGHRWSLASQIRSLTPEQIRQAAAEIDFSAGCGAEG